MVVFSPVGRITAPVRLGRFLLFACLLALLPALPVRSASSTLSALTLSTSVPSPQPINTPITFTATATGGTNVQYQFWLYNPSATPAWNPLQTYSSSATCPWTPATAGNYLLSVTAQDSGGVQVNQTLWYTVVNSLLSGLTVSAAPVSPQPVNTPITVTAAATGGTNVQYQFWVYNANVTPAWNQLQAFSAQATCPWTPAAAGNYLLSVTVQDSSGAQVNQTLWYTIGVPLTGLTVNTAPVSPQPVNTSITFTAQPTGGSNVQYQFWLYNLNANPAWSQLQAFSAQASCTWTPTAAGNYLISVTAQDGVTGKEINSSFWYVINGPALTGVTVTAAPASPQSMNTAVTFTAAATGGTNVHYQFWLYNAAATPAWSQLQAFSAQTSCTWTPTAAGAYLMSITAQDSSNGAEVNTSLWDTVTATSPLSAVSVSAAPASPQAANTPVTVTAVATGGTSIVYQFWLYTPTATPAWSQLQAYSSSPTCTWTPTAAGSYMFSVTASDNPTGTQANGTLWYTVTAPIVTTGTVTGVVESNNPTAPVPGATVAVVGFPQLTATTSAEGSYTIQNVPAGAQSLQVSCTGYTATTVSATVVAGSVVTVNAYLTQLMNSTSGEVTGVVTSDSVPLPGATVSVIGSSITTLSLADGSYSLLLPLGTQTLLVSCAGQTTLRLPVTVTAETITTVNASLTPAKFKWTMLVYLDADNDLEAFGLMNMLQMEMVGSTSDVEVLVEFARPATGMSTTWNDEAGNSTTGYPFTLLASDAAVNGAWGGTASDTRRYLVTKNPSSNPTAMSSTVLADLGPTDMGNPQTLNDFITWGQQYAPAEHYMVDVWDHGSGWDPYYDATRAMGRTSSRTGTRAICIDNTFNDQIRDVELPAALAATYNLDIVAADACMMAMTEVAYEIHDQGSYLLASEEDEPGSGFPYTDMMTALTTQPTISPAAFASYTAKDAVSAWIAQNNAANTANGTDLPADVTCSVIDLSQMPAVATALAPFSARLLALGSQDPSSTMLTGFTNAWYQAQYFGPNGLNVDLKDYAYCFDDPNGVSGFTDTPVFVDAQLQADAVQLETAIGSAVIETDASPDLWGAFGMSVYFPTADLYNYPSTEADDGGNSYLYYPLLSINSVAQWDLWLAGQPELTY